MNMYLTTTKHSTSITILDRVPLPPNNPFGRRIKAPPISQEKNRKNIYNRELKKVINTLEMNITEYSKYVTFTINKSEYPKECFNPNYISDTFRRFIEKYKKNLKKYDICTPPKYVRFLDKSKEDNSWHLHVIFFSELHISKFDLEKLWKLGSVNIESISEYMRRKKFDNYDYLARYNLKSKKALISLNLPSLHIYSPSRGLESPRVISYNDDPISFEAIYKKVCKKEILSRDQYKHSFLGNVKKIKYNTKEDSNELLNFIDNGECF